MLSKTIIVSGRVQGVGYRYFVYNTVHLTNGLTGYVKNMPDGTVKIVVNGEEQKIKFLLDKLYMGPTMSRVNNVQVFEYESNKKIEGFKIEY